jgi:hypothetical protein
MESPHTYRYKATFRSIANIVTPSDQERQVAKASLLPLKSILPPDVNPEENPDLLYIAADGAVAGLCNRNGDAIDAKTALAIHSTAKHKYISVEHDRDQIVGVILYPALTRLDSNQPLSDDEAAALNEPFNMAFAGVLWKVANPLITKYINGSSDEPLSMSWEIAFDTFDIGIGDHNVFRSSIVSHDDPAFGTYVKMLRSEGGEGKDHKGQEVYRIITGNPIILGYSIVGRPAAHVKGILAITASDEKETCKTNPSISDVLAELPESQRAIFTESSICELCDITMSDGTKHIQVPVLAGRYTQKNIDVDSIVSIKISAKSEEKNITHANERVNSKTPTTMKIESLEQLESNWADIRKLETAASVADFVKAIKQGSDDYMKKLQDRETAAQQAEAARAEMEKTAKQLETSIADLQKELEEVRDKAESAEAMQKFNERMASFDEEFDLDDEDRKIVASDIKNLDDDAFAAYMSKCKKLMSAKSKSAKKDKKDDKSMDNDDKKDSKASIASVKEDKSQANIPNTVTVDENMLAEMAKAFGGSLKINGKAINSKNSQKTA